ncbi:MAG: galactose oxidase [Prevotellaceae bacterium]|jgi:N-acetylneuraminic acid mutarotase|nr:galactose oxidase [Prevotellaceae bacterium]
MKIRKKCVLLLSAAVITGTVCGCGSKAEEALLGNWTTLGDFDGSARNGAVGFVIGDAAYVCLGYNDKYKNLRDLYKYDPVNKTWTKKEAFPGAPRHSATAFVVNGKGYVGLGYDGTFYYDDFWEYDPVRDQWDSVTALFPGGARYGAASASANGKGYVGTGWDGGNVIKDFYSFTPGSERGTGTWAETSGYEGSKRQGGCTFVIGKYIYLFGGVTNGGNPTDMLRYDVTADKWEKVLDLRNTDKTSDDDKYDNISRAYACTFVINGKGYVTLGRKSSSYSSSTYEYDPSANKWTERTSFSRATREGAVSFSLSETSKSRGFVMLGLSSNTRFDDFFEFFPTVDNNTYDD